MTARRLTLDTRTTPVGAVIVLAAVPDRITRIFRVVGLEPASATRPTAQDAEAPSHAARTTD